ncbi:MAG: hypothetical protein IC227_03610 [Enterococcus lacertideformus]|uniref:Uncharacterized protein n=1 Tax=Enterococcus lacertideformus TaxID=2771493 RepID=A0A931ATM6_9ENTE|nr:hypothetical protein [Enterococcus lacertideformus]
MTKVLKKANEEKETTLSCKKSYMNGYHLAVKIDEGSKLNIFLKKIKLCESDDGLNFAKIEKQIKIISKFEESQESNLPLKRQGEIVITESDQPIYPAKQIYLSLVVEKIEEAETRLLMNIISDWEKLNEQEQNVLIEKLFLIFGIRNKYGLKYSYLAFKSNVEYFKDQLLDFTDRNRKKVLEYIEGFTTEETVSKEEIKNLIESSEYENFDYFFEKFLI